VHAVPTLAETVASFDGRSSDYDDSRMHQFFAQQAAEAAAPEPGQTLLDLAGGTGLTARAALPALRHGMALVADASPGMLRAARHADPRLLVLQVDAHHLPLRDHAVDLLTCVTALHLFAEPLRALRQAVRVTKPHGRVVFTTWSANGWSHGRRLRAAATAERLTCTDPHAASGTPEAAARLAEAAGLMDVQVRECRHREPLPTSAGIWEHVLGTPQAEPVRAAPAAAQQRVRERFEADLTDVEHVLLLVSGVPQTSMPSR